MENQGSLTTHFTHLTLGAEGELGRLLRGSAQRWGREIGSLGAHFIEGSWTSQFFKAPRILKHEKMSVQGHQNYGIF